MNLTWMRLWLGLLIVDVVVAQTNVQDGFGLPWRDLSESSYKEEDIRRVDEGDLVYLPSRMDENLGTSTENPMEERTVPKSPSEVLTELPVNVRTLIDNAFKDSDPGDSGLIITREELLERLPVIVKLLQIISGSEVPEDENGLYINKLSPSFAALKKIKEYPCALISCTRNGKNLDPEERTTAAARLLREAETVTAASLSMSPDQRRFLGILLSRVSRNIEEELSTIATTSTNETITELPERVVLPPPPPVVNTTTPSTNTSLKAGTRQNNPSIDEIITGIVQLLGGNVRVSKPPAGFRLRPTVSGNRRVASSKRVNDRGPALFAITSTSVIQPSVVEDDLSTSVALSSSERPVEISSSTSDSEPALISSLVTPSEVSTSSHISPTPSVNFVEVSESYLMTPVSSVRIRIFSTPVSIVKPVSIRLKPKSTPKISITPTKSLEITSSSTVEVLPTVTSSFNEEESLTSSVTPADKDIVYGKPVETAVVRAPGGIQPSKTVRPSDDEVSTVIGIGTLDKPLNQSVSLPPEAPTGRPYIVPVEIEEVRPFIGSYPGRPLPGRPGDFGVGGVRKPPPGTPAKNNSYPSRPGYSGGPPKPNRPYGYPDSNKASTPRPPGVRKPPPPYNRPAIRPRPNPPLVRIDTCIVGDDSTCDVQLNERCVTELGVSSCHCRPGLARTIPRGPCNPVISVSMAMKIDRIADRQITFNKKYLDTSSDDYRILEQETNLALNSLFTYTSFSRTFVGATINKFHPSNGGLIVNTTIQLEENESNKHPVVQRLLQQEILNAITSRNLNIGDSNLYLNSPPRQGPLVHDLNECELVTANDCSGNGVCQNTFGSFRCTCKPGFMDKHPSENWKSGRLCSVCSPTMCSNHGECIVKDGRRECKCKGNFIGTRCEIDGEVLGVALGASLAALVIIILTLVCLCVWNRRWKRDQHKAAITPQYAYTLSKKNTPAPGATHVRVSVEDRMRWAHIADAMGNIYVHDSLPALPSTSAPPALPPPPPPHSCPSSMKHIYATPSRLLLQKACEDNDRNRLYGHIRPKSRSSHLVPVQTTGGYYDLNEFPSLGSMHSRDPYGNAHYGNPNMSKSTSYY